MSLAALLDIREGIVYSLVRMRWYVSRKVLVSKGGWPTKSVYLFEERINKNVESSLTLSHDI